MNKIKVAFYLNMYLKGGVEKSLLTYLNALDQDKFDISLIIANHMGNYELSKQDIPSYIKIIYLMKSPLLNKFIQKKINTKLLLIERFIENIFLKLIRKLIFNYKIKILLNYSTVVDYGFNLLNNAHIFSSKNNLIGFFHFDIIHYNNFSESLLAKKIINYSRIICITKNMYHQAIKRFDFIKDKFYLLYNQIDFEYISLKSKDNSQFSDNLPFFQLIKSGDYIISIARLEEQYKDFPTLIKAYAKCFYQFNLKLPLVIIGDGGIRNKLESLTKTLKINHMVYFLGFQYNPYVFLKNAKICILSSRSEGFGLILVEAMILQVPVIATNCPVGPQEILLNGRCGLLCKVSDVDDMVNAINTLYQNPQKCQELINNANQYLERFNINKNIDIFSGLLQI